MNKPEVIVEMENLNETIRAKKLELYDVSIRIADRNKSIDEIQTAMMVEITNEKDSAGKALYSNAEKRAVQLNKQLSESAAYMQMKCELDCDNDIKKILSIDIEYLINKFKIFECLCTFSK